MAIKYTKPKTEYAIVLNKNNFEMAFFFPFTSFGESERLDNPSAKYGVRKGIIEVIFLGRTHWRSPKTKIKISGYDHISSLI